MRKSAFTLSELLIVLGVIGVVAAITAPILSNVMPDKNKMNVLKTYKVIADINEDLFDDPSLSWQIDADGQASMEGFLCATPPVNPKYTDAVYSVAETKYPYLLANKLELSTNPSSNGSVVNFSTTDGKEWNVEKVTTGFKITVKMDASSTKNCVYSSTCKRPDTFEFIVDQGGDITGGDGLTQAYLQNKTKLNDKKNDYSNASSALNKSDESNGDSNNGIKAEHPDEEW